MKPTHISKNLHQVYGTGQFNPRRFDRAKKPDNNKRLYLWGLGIFIFAIVLAIGLGMYLFGRGEASFTGERVTLEIVGPQQPAAHAPLEYSIRIANSEELDLKGAEVFLGFSSPATTPGVFLVTSEKPPKSEVANTWDIGAVSAGGEAALGVTLRFSGDIGAQVRLPLSATFKPKGFSGSYTVNTEAVFTLGESAIGLSIAGPSSVASGSETALSIRIANADSLNSDARLFVEFPSPFSPVLFDPSRLEGADSWPLSSLRRTGEGYELGLRGTVSGATGNAIRVAIRLQDASGIVLAQKEHVISISGAKAELALAAKPAQGAKLQWGEELTITLDVRNTSDYVMRDAVVSVALGGEDLRQSDSLVINQGGFFEGGRVLWDSNTTSAFESLRPGSAVALSFSLTARESPPRGFSSRPAITAKAALSATLLDEETVAESQEVVVNVLANVEFGAAGEYVSGLHPPLPGEETEYAVVWTVGPTNGALENLTLSADIPSAGRWIGNGTYSVGELSREAGRITWRASAVPALAEPITIRFTVGLTASGTPTNSTPIFGASSLSATDAGAREVMEFFAPAVTIGSVQ